MHGDTGEDGREGGTSLKQWLTTLSRVSFPLPSASYMLKTCLNSLCGGGGGKRDESCSHAVGHVREEPQFTAERVRGLVPLLSMALTVF